MSFLDAQVLWKCKCADWLEDANFEAANCRFRWDEPPSAKPNARDLSVESFGLLVGQYTNRDLTYDKDICDAFSGIMDAIPDDFFCGLPLSRFAEHLCWNRAPGRLDFDEILRRRTQVDAPTWSWMAWKSRIRMECTDERSGSLIYCYRLREQTLECISRPKLNTKQQLPTTIDQLPGPVRHAVELINCPLALREPELFTIERTIDRIPAALIQPDKITANHIIFVASAALLYIRKTEPHTRTFYVHPVEVTADAPAKKHLLPPIGSFSAYQDPQPESGSAHLFAVIAGRDQSLYLMMTSWRDGTTRREYIVKVDYGAWVSAIKERTWGEASPEMRLFTVG